MLRLTLLVRPLVIQSRPIGARRSLLRGFQCSNVLSSDDKDVVNSALNGDLASARQLGEEHFDSDFARARPWLELAVELGDIESSYLLGVGLKNLREQEVEKDVVVEAKNREEVIKQIHDAKKEARRAKKERIRVKKGSSGRGEKDSTVTFSSDLDEESGESAEFWLRKAAKTDHTSAMVLLANLLIEEEGNISKQEALMWYRKAAGEKHPDALFNLGTLYFNGIEGLLKPDENASLLYFEEAADLGDQASLYWVGHCYLSEEGGVRKRDTSKALRYLKKASEQGHIAAHYHLAIIYRTGVEDIQVDKEAFLRHLSIAVEGEDPDALFCLADCLMQGLDGYPQDQAQAVPYLERAAANEHADAAVTLGALHYGGLAGLPQDKRKAFELYNTAAELGSVDAWRNLASMYYIGDGVPKNEEVARQIMKVVFNKDGVEDDPKP